MYNISQFITRCWNSSENRTIQIAAGLVGALVSCILTTYVFWQNLVATNVLRYADSNLPMLDTPDGYFFLSRTMEMMQDGLSWESVSALSTLLALLHKITWLPPEISAFWLPFLLALGCGAICGLWGRLIQLPPLLTGLAAFIGGIIPSWYRRIHVGSLDTDGAIYLLLTLSLYLLATLALPSANLLARRAKLQKWAWLLLCALLLSWIWFPGLLLLVCSFWIWAVTWCWTSSPREQTWRKKIAFALPSLAMFVLLLAPAFLPEQVAALRDMVFGSMGYVTNPSNAVIYQSIAELQKLSLANWLIGLGSDMPRGGLMVGGFLLLAWRFPRESLFLLPCVALQLLGLKSNRFLFFGMLPMALGAACLPLAVSAIWIRLTRLIPFTLTWTKRSFAPVQFFCSARQTGSLLGAALILWLVWGQTTEASQWRNPPVIGKAEDQIVIILREAVNKARQQGENVALMNWWDEGYFLRCRVGLPPFFDGGSQTPIPAFIAARGFALDHSELSRHWIRYFALHGEHGLAGWQPLINAWKNENTALNALNALFLAPEEERSRLLAQWPVLDVPAADNNAASRKLESVEDKMAWLFPKGRVFIFLPVRFLSISPWWRAMGERPDSDMSLVQQHVQIVARSRVNLDPKTGVMTLPPEIPVPNSNGSFVLPTAENPFVNPWGANLLEPLAIMSPFSPWCYLTDKILARTIAFRLLAPSCEQIPGFVPVAVNYGAAGAWEVLY